MSIKMSRFVLAVFAVLAIFAVSTMGQNSCPSNQAWNNCGSACPATCDDPDPSCGPQCVPRCVCDEGLVRDDSGTCVTRDNC